MNNELSMSCYAFHMHTIRVVAQHHVHLVPGADFFVLPYNPPFSFIDNCLTPVLRVLHDNTTKYGSEHANARNRSACKYEEYLYLFPGPPSLQTSKAKQSNANNRIPPPHHLLESHRSHRTPFSAISAQHVE